MRRKFHSLRRRYALRWHRTQRMESAGAGEGLAYAFLLTAGILALVGMVILVLVHR